LELKEAVTEESAFMVIVQVGSFPMQAPDQPAKSELESGEAVSTTTVPGLKLDPGGLAATIPFPDPAIETIRVRVSIILAKVAAMVWAAVIVLKV
jgi:hypothetical protein